MARVFISCKLADKAKVLPLQQQIEAAVGESCWLDADSTANEDAVAGGMIMQALNQASVVILMYSHLHAEISDYKTDWAIRELNYAQETGKRIVFVGIDRTPLTRWFIFMFPQQRLVDSSSAEEWQKLLGDLPKWLNTEADNEKIIEEEIEYTNGLEYIFDTATGEATVVSAGSVTDICISIPPTVLHDGKEYAVVAIAPKAFQRCYEVIVIKIPDTVKEIGERAFEQCASLASITLPYGVKEIKKFTFSKCSSLLSVSIPETVTHIRTHAFISCENLNSVRLPDSLKYIGYGAFSNCANLTTVNIPQGIKRMSFMAFYGTKTPIAKDNHKWVILFAIAVNVVFWGAIAAMIICLLT